MKPHTAFFIAHGGHAGGGWLWNICTHNPTAQISVIAECHIPTSLDFARRGVPYPHPSTAYDDEIYNFFRSRIHYQDDCVGIIKSFRTQHIAWLREHVPGITIRLCQMVRNPRYNFVGKWTTKAKRVPLAKIFGREPQGEREVFEAVALYYAETFYKKWLRFKDEYYMVRLEDLNASLKGDGVYFQRFMGWLTRANWPDEYVAYIREHLTPAYKYDTWVDWDAWPDGSDRVQAVHCERRDVQQWAYRDNWDEDPEVARRWDRLNDWQQDIYRRVIGPYEKRLGYNQAYPGSTDAEWEGQDAAPWG